MLTEGTTVRKTLTIGAIGLAAAAALTLTSADASAQSGYPSPPPGFEPAVAPPPQGYYVPPSIAMSGPRQLNDWEPGEPIPPGYHPVTRIRKGLVIGGSVLFGTVYLISALTGAAVSDVCTASGSASCGRSAKLLFIPVVGPFTMLGNTTSALGNFALVLDGLAQAGGVAMLIAGIAAPKTVLVRNDLAKPKLEISPVPMSFGSNSAGFGFVGRF